MMSWAGPACPDLQHFFVSSKLDLAPSAAFGATMLARVPFSFALGIFAAAVDEQVQRSV